MLDHLVDQRPLLCQGSRTLIVYLHMLLLILPLIFLCPRTPFNGGRYFASPLFVPVGVYSGGVVFVALSRVHLVQEDLAVELAQESLNQLEYAIIELRGLDRVLFFVINCDAGHSHVGLAERLLLDASGRVFVNHGHWNGLVAV